MRKYKDLEIEKRVPLMMGISSLLVLSIVCGLLLRPLRSSALDDAATIAKLSAEAAGGNLAERINGSARVIRAYAGIIAQMTESDAIPVENRRDILLGNLKVLIASEKNLSNVWCIVEPNAIDGLDSLYKDRPCTNDDGVWMPWLIDGQISNASHLVSSELYRVPKSTGREFLSKPYEDILNGKQAKVFSLSIPIMLHGKFIGVIATDFDINEMVELIASYQSSTTGKLISNEGIVMVYKDMSRIGALAEHGNREILNKLPEGRLFTGIYEFEGKMFYKVYDPIKLGEGITPWYYAVDVPVLQIYAKSKTISLYLIMYCLLGVILIGFAGWLLMKPILKGISKVTNLIHDLSRGSINIKIDDNQSRDEIGTMNNKLQELVNGIKDKAVFAEGIGRGNLDADFHELSEDDTLGKSLLDMRQSLQKAEQEHAARATEEKQRNWGTEGLARFAEILRKDNDNMKILSYNIISNMVQYLNINQGGIFVLNESENEAERFLEMQACYAFNRKKFLEKQIRPGEGLVGACFLEGKPIYMTQIPDEYITITSGLGEANPKAVFICPLKVNDTIYGVIELASFQPFEPFELDFVQKVSESIASTIATVQVNVRTLRLLEQTKLQAEEMANTEEELRQNMEEMQSTQEEMRRREDELQNILGKMNEIQAAGEEKEFEMKRIQELLFSSLNIIEFSVDGIITEVTQNLASLFNVDKSFPVGKPMAAFIGEKSYTKTMASLVQGKIVEEVHTVKTGEIALAIRHIFLPICNKQGELMRVLMLAFPENKK